MVISCGHLFFCQELKIMLDKVPNRNYNRIIKWREGEKIGEIKEKRIALGLTQKQFSELFSPPIPIDTIKKWDSGKMQPPDWVEGLIIEKLEREEKKDGKV